MKRFTLLLALFAIGCVQSTYAWNGLGHSTVAAIAERHLTPRAKANIAKYIDNKSIIYYATWMDNNRKIEPYTETHYWHVDYWSDDMRKDADGNPLPPKSAGETVRIIGDMGDFRSLCDSLVRINIIYLTHLVGDMHCPAHVDYQKSRMRITLDPDPKKVSFHKVWDGMVASRKHPGISPCDYAQMLDRLTAEEVAEIQKGEVMEWYDQTAEATAKIHAMVREDKVIDKKYFNDAIDIAETQIRNAGLRLAAVLNAIFDK